MSSFRQIVVHSIDNLLPFGVVVIDEAGFDSLFVGSEQQVILEHERSASLWKVEIVGNFGDRCAILSLQKNLDLLNGCLRSGHA